MKLKQSILIPAVIAVTFVRPALADNYEAVCGSVGSGSQASQYCKAAKEAREAAQADDTLWKVYAAVAGLCLATCGVDYASGGTNAIPAMVGKGADIGCSLSSIGASAADIVMTKDYTAAIGVVTGGYSLYQEFSGGASKSATTNAGGAVTASTKDGASATGTGTGTGTATGTGTGTATGTGTGSGTTAAQGAGDTYSSPDFMGTGIKLSCITAASAALSVYLKKQAQEQETKTENQNLQYAEEVGSGSSGGTSVAAGSNFAQPAVSTTQASTSSTVGTTAPQLASGTPPSTQQSACGGAAGLGNAISCAATAAPALANTISNPDFQNAFQTTAGMPLNDFLQQAGNLGPSGSIAAGAAGAITPSGLNQLQANLASLEKGMIPLDESGGIYAGGGGGGGGDSGGSDVGSVVGNLMKQFGPKAAGGKQSNGVSEASFKGEQRNLASFSAPRGEETSMSLFERVTYRYVLVTARLTGAGPTGIARDWSVPVQSSR